MGILITWIPASVHYDGHINPINVETARFCIENRAVFALLDTGDIRFSEIVLNAYIKLRVIRQILRLAQ